MNICQLGNQKPTRLHHPCSGIHMLMLASCEKFSYKKDLYWDPSHPLQKKIFSLIGKEVGEQIRWAYDMCGLPTFYIPVRAQLAMWERLALDKTEEVERLKTLWTNNPKLVGGQGRLDSNLMVAMGGRVLVKEGFDGAVLVQSLGIDDGPVAGLFVKVSSGYQRDHLALGLLAAISGQPSLPPVFHEIAEYLESQMDEFVPRGQRFVRSSFEK